MDTDTLIDVQHLTRYYGSHRAVHDLSFQVRRGEVLGFLGPNGAGKSTTMQMITGNLALPIVEWRRLHTQPYPPLILSKRSRGRFPSCWRDASRAADRRTS